MRELPGQKTGPRRPRITGDTLELMDEVSIRELRNHGGEVVERAQAGEQLTVTKAGKPVAVLSPLPAPAVSLTEIIRRRVHLPVVDPDALRADIDDAIEPSLW